MDKKSKHKTAVKKKTLNPEFNEVLGAGDHAVVKLLSLLWGRGPWRDWVLQGSLWGVGRGQQESPQPWGMGERQGQAEQAEVEQAGRAGRGLESSSED